MEYGFCIFLISLFAILAFAGTYGEARNAGFERKGSVFIGLLVAFSCFIIGICLLLICSGQL